MTKTPTHNAQATIRQILELEKIECDIVRVAVPDMQSARALRMIKKAVHIPLVADIHFDHSPRQTRKYFGTRNTLCQQSDIHTA
jgi:(E)-4-hydroxy-3-methylbut-2-enyl-diphosphate synthase